MKNGQSILKLLALPFMAGGVALLAVGAFAGLLSGVWLFTLIMGSIGFIFLGVGGICISIHNNKLDRKRKLMAAGKFVHARVMDIYADPYRDIHVDQISMNPFFIMCRYVDGSGAEYDFKSEALLYNPSGLLRTRQLKVYVDLARPKRYYVDTNEILPESAMLHKFKFDKEKNARKLVEAGKYIHAITCGVELIGRIKVNGILKPGFLRLPGSIARQFGMALDEKGCGFLGYTILCRYDAPDGTIHIFASEGIWGEPESLHVGEEVKVYYSGDGYRKYHVDVKPLLWRQAGLC